MEPQAGLQEVCSDELMNNRGFIFIIYCCNLLKLLNTLFLSLCCSSVNQNWRVVGSVPGAVCWSVLGVLDVSLFAFITFLFLQWFADLSSQSERWQTLRPTNGSVYSRNRNFHSIKDDLIITFALLFHLKPSLSVCVCEPAVKRCLSCSLGEASPSAERGGAGRMWRSSVWPEA